MIILVAFFIFGFVFYSLTLAVIWDFVCKNTTPRNAFKMDMWMFLNVICFSALVAVCCMFFLATLS